MQQHHRLAIGECDIYIRPHPSDTPDKYLTLCEKYARANVQLSSSAHLYEDIGLAEWVVGLQSYALVVAMAAGKRVVSCLPPVAPACVLPYENIIHLRDFEGASGE